MAHEPVKYLYPARDGRWKYLRDVPKRLHAVLGRKRWEYSLGSNRTEALKKWARWCEEHDALIASLKSKEAIDAYQQHQKSTHDADTLRNVARLGLSAVMERNGKHEYWRADRPVDYWHDTERVMRQARSSDPVKEWQRLSRFAGIAYGDTAPMEEVPEAQRDPFSVALSDVSADSRPDDPTSKALYEANHSVLRKRLAELSPRVSPDAPDRILKFYEGYAAHRGHKELTVVDYEKKLKDFIDDIGDLRIGEITKEHLRKYRDSLSGRMKEVSSVIGYMVPIKALLAHAFSEEMIPANPAAGLKMPSDPKTIEDRKHLPFKPAEVPIILDAINTVWADENNNSRLSLERRRLYRLTIEALLHTGARPHELWRLTPNDAGVHEEHNWPYRGINIQNTKDGKRLLPCPDKALPFLDLVKVGGLAALNANTDKELGRRIKAFSGERQFDKILTDLKIKRPRVSLYSTRATYVSALQRNGYDDTMKENIIGHVGSARMLRHYKSPEEMKDMLAAMQSVQYGR